MVWRRVLGVSRLVARASWLATVVMSTLAPGVEAQPRDRPIRVGNSNLLFVGGGYSAHDHPTFDANGFINLAYQRRILRREVRMVPLWVRGAVNFVSEEREYQGWYTYWDDPAAGEGAGLETVEERTSDFAVRLEALFDLLHRRTAALYAGGGIVIHSVSFRSRGLSSGRQGAAGLETTDNALAPSAVVGGRLFMATKPYTAYAELRYGFTYGRAEGVQDIPLPDKGVPTIRDFELDSVSNFSIEGGIAFHW